LRPQCADLLREGDEIAKKYHDRTTPLVDLTFVAGDLVYRRQRRIGKLLPKVEGPYEFLRYVSSSKAAVWDPNLEREVKIHVSLLVAA